jgi:hypothetical protein
MFIHLYVETNSIMKIWEENSLHCNNFFKYPQVEVLNLGQLMKKMNQTKHSSIKPNSTNKLFGIQALNITYQLTFLA